MDTARWNGRRILTELCDPERRRQILTTFWKKAEPHTRALATLHLAKALHFREGTINKSPPERKAELLASRLGQAELEETLEMALMLYHTQEAGLLMAWLLDFWKIPHEHGSIESDDYTPPTEVQVRAGVAALGDRFSRADVVLYLATAGLLMGQGWREATWPVVGELHSVPGSDTTT